jgi:hypothetical protein
MSLMARRKGAGDLFGTQQTATGLDITCPPTDTKYLPSFLLASSARQHLLIF